MPEGEVESANPAIETIFSILSRSEINRDGERYNKKLLFTLQAEFSFVLELAVVGRPFEGFPHVLGLAHYLSTDMPNLMGKWRIDYSTDRENRPVDGLWKVESDRLVVDEKRTLIRENSWEIRLPRPNPTIRFTLRRKELTEPPIAACPFQP